MARISRRAFLSRSAAAALAVPGGVPLQGCGKRDPTGAAPGASGPLLASPDNPVTWPLLAVALGTLVYRRFTRGERGRESAVQDLAAQV